MKAKYIVATLPLLLCSACDPVTWMFGGAAVVGTTAVRNDNGVIGSISDTELQAKINAKLMNEDKDLFDRVELCVKHGMVVVIGYMDDESQCQRAIQIVRSVGGWREVFDETKVQEAPKAKDLVVDSSITSRIKSSLTFDGNVQSLNYDVTTVKGVVYICGTAQNKYERDIVLNYARTTSGVEKVVCYVKIKDNSK